MIDSLKKHIDLGLDTSEVLYWVRRMPILCKA